MKLKKSVVCIGSNGFPFGSATVYRKLQIANMLKMIGYSVFVINRIGIHHKSKIKKEKITCFGKYHNINYVHASLIHYRPKNFVVRNTLKILSLISEFFIILHLRIFLNCDLMICNSIDLNSLKYYSCIAKIFGMKFIYDYVEFVDSLKNRDAERIDQLKLNFEKYFYKYVDYYIVISNYLQNYLDALKTNSKKIIIPPTQDYSYLDSIDKLNSSERYFMYCGSVEYMDAIEFIIGAFIKSNAQKNGVLLYLVINGSDLEITLINKKFFNLVDSGQIIILTQISYHLLNAYYKTAEALLLPLKNTIQDKARFPFKLSEYLASKRPVITSNIGVVLDYLVDNKNALIADPEDLNSFVEKMNFVLDNTTICNEIGNNGYALGKQKFSNDIYIEVLSELSKL